MTAVQNQRLAGRVLRDYRRRYSFIGTSPYPTARAYKHQAPRSAEVRFLPGACSERSALADLSRVRCLRPCGASALGPVRQPRRVLPQRPPDLADGHVHVDLAEQLVQQVIVGLAHLHEHAEPAARVEGYKTAEWILLDYGDFVMHVFEQKARKFYDLERLWRESKRVELPPEFSSDSAGSLRRES